MLKSRRLTFISALHFQTDASCIPSLEFPVVMPGMRTISISLSYSRKTNGYVKRALGMTH